MDKSEIEVRLLKIEQALATETDLSFNRILVLAGEWGGLNKAIGRDHEGPWRLIGALYDGVYAKNKK